MITRKALARRTFLRGMGTAVAVPLLDAMTPAFAAVELSVNPPLLVKSPKTLKEALPLVAIVTSEAG